MNNHDIGPFNLTTIGPFLPTNVGPFFPTLTMTKQHECFLVVCNTMHFTRAAEHLHISQQALSEQIRKLEDDLDVQLFIRKPKLRLTPAGKILYESLIQMSKIERTMNAKLGELTNIASGSINLGIHTARAFVVMTPILETFHEKYPNVQINMVSAQTLNYTKLLEDGQIDFFLGINTPNVTRNDIDCETIAEEPMFLVICKSALEKEFGGILENILYFSVNGFDLSLVKDTPFIVSTSISQGQNAVNRYLDRKNIKIKKGQSQILWDGTFLT